MDFTSEVFHSRKILLSERPQKLFCIQMFHYGNIWLNRLLQVELQHLKGSSRVNINNIFSHGVAKLTGLNVLRYMDRQQKGGLLWRHSFTAGYII